MMPFSHDRNASRDNPPRDRIPAPPPFYRRPAESSPAPSQRVSKAPDLATLFLQKLSAPTTIENIFFLKTHLVNSNGEHEEVAAFLSDLLESGIFTAEAFRKLVKQASEFEEIAANGTLHVDTDFYRLLLVTKKLETLIKQSGLPSCFSAQKLVNFLDCSRAEVQFVYAIFVNLELHKPLPPHLLPSIRNVVHYVLDRKNLEALNKALSWLLCTAPPFLKEKMVSSNALLQTLCSCAQLQEIVECFNALGTPSKGHVRELISQHQTTTVFHRLFFLTQLQTLFADMYQMKHQSAGDTPLTFPGWLDTLELYLCLHQNPEQLLEAFAKFKAVALPFTDRYFLFYSQLYNLRNPMEGVESVLSQAAILFPTPPVEAAPRPFFYRPSLFFPSGTSYPYTPPISKRPTPPATRDPFTGSSERLAPAVPEPHPPVTRQRGSSTIPPSMSIGPQTRTLQDAIPLPEKHRFTDDTVKEIYRAAGLASEEVLSWTCMHREPIAVAHAIAAVHRAGLLYRPDTTTINTTYTVPILNGCIPGAGHDLLVKLVTVFGKEGLLSNTLLEILVWHYQLGADQLRAVVFLLDHFYQCSKKGDPILQKMLTHSNLESLLRGIEEMQKQSLCWPVEHYVALCRLLIDHPNPEALATIFRRHHTEHPEQSVDATLSAYTEYAREAHPMMQYEAPEEHNGTSPTPSKRRRVRAEEMDKPKAPTVDHKIERRETRSTAAALRSGTRSTATALRSGKGRP